MSVQIVSLNLNKRRFFKLAFWLVAAPAYLLGSQRLMSFAVKCMYRFDTKGV